MGKNMNKFIGLRDTIQKARRMGYQIKYYPNPQRPIYIDLKTRDYPSQLIHIGFENTRFFIDVMLGNLSGEYTENLHRSDGLTQLQVQKEINHALSGQYIGKAIQRRLTHA